METRLGEFKRADIRGIWPNEAAHFTPWLAEEENIVRLGNALGIELEVEKVEAAVGPYSADILAKDPRTDSYVVIENQLGKTDHDHLGKAITYGSVLHASAIVWIAAAFTEEHRRALEWLNEFTTDDLSFYGVQIEVWRIDNSRPALRFEVISSPPAIKKHVAGAGSDELSETQKLQLDFWTAFRDRLLEAKVLTTAQTPRPQSTFDVTLGRSSIFLCCRANTYERMIGVRVYIRNTVAEKAMAQLLEQKEEIERELGVRVEWDPNESARDKTIEVRQDADLQDRSRWDEYLEWLVDMTARFYRTFGPRVKKLSLR